MTGFVRSFLTLLLLSTFVLPALAADLKARPPAPAAVPTWTGFYVGVNGGMNLGSYNPIFGVGEEATTANLDDNNWLVGVHMGYLVQTGVLVVGPEIGIQYWGFKNEVELVPGVPASLLQQIDWSAYAGVRVGIAFNEFLMPYVGGGVHWAHIKGSIPAAGGLLDTANSALGWYVAGGVEFRIAQNTTLGVEYRHIDFGDVQTAIIMVQPSNLAVDQITGRLNYRLPVSR